VIKIEFSTRHPGSARWIREHAEAQHDTKIRLMVYGIIAEDGTFIIGGDGVVNARELSRLCKQITVQCERALDDIALRESMNRPR